MNFLESSLQLCMKKKKNDSIGFLFEVKKKLPLATLCYFRLIYGGCFPGRNVLEYLCFWEGRKGVSTITVCYPKCCI